MYSVGETCPVPKYEAERAKEAEAKHRANGGDRKSEAYKESATSNLSQPIEDKKRNPTVAAEVAKKIGVSENTYRDIKTAETRNLAF